MEDSDNDSGLDDPVVRMRKPKNCTDVRTRHMALNAEGIRVVREMESMINIESKWKCRISNSIIDFTYVGISKRR